MRARTISKREASLEDQEGPAGPYDHQGFLSIIITISIMLTIITIITVMTIIPFVIITTINCYFPQVSEFLYLMSFAVIITAQSGWPFNLTNAKGATALRPANPLPASTEHTFFARQRPLLEKLAEGIPLNACF